MKKDDPQRFSKVITQDALIPGIIKERHLIAGSGANAGDLVYSNNSGGFTNLPIGSTNQFLISSGGVPLWKTLFNDLTQSYKINFGTTTISIVTATTGNKAVTFSTAFSTATSLVLLSVNNSTNDPSTYTVQSKTLSKTGFTSYLTSTVSTTDTITIAFLAIGY